MKNNMDQLIHAFADILTESEIVTAVQLGKISSVLEATRIEKGMTQKEFAKFMGVSQSMVSKWESEEYNFTVAHLANICEKLNLNLEISMKPQWSSYKEHPFTDQKKWTGNISGINFQPMKINGVA